jgi:hypothetical protein
LELLPSEPAHLSMDGRQAVPPSAARSPAASPASLASLAVDLRERSANVAYAQYQY